MIDEQYHDLLNGPVVATVVTLMPNGYPQATPVWFDFDGDNIWVNTAAGRQKDKNLIANGKVTLSIIDPQNPYRWVEIRGDVIERTTDGAVAHIDRLAKLYAGKASYYGDFAPADRATQEQRVIYKIKPVKVNASG